MRLKGINGAQRKSRNPATRPKYERRMLEALASGLSPARAAKAAGVGRSTAYLWRQQDPEFAQKWDEAVAEGIDWLEEEARRRAVEGFNKRPIYHRGVIVGEIRQYSDKLLMFLLKRRMPEVYARDANRPKGFARSHDASRKVDTKEEVLERMKRLGLEAYYEVDAPRERETTPEKTENLLPESKR
jgi:hypothetical protein